MAYFDEYCVVNLLFAFFLLLSFVSNSPDGFQMRIVLVDRVHDCPLSAERFTIGIAFVKLPAAVAKVSDAASQNTKLTMT